MLNFRTASKPLLLLSMVIGLWLVAEAFNYGLGSSTKPAPSPIGQTPSVLTFAYDNLRSGFALSTIHADRSLAAQPIKLSAGKNASKWMPLYINGFGDGKKYFPQRRVLIFSSESKLLAVDLDKDEILWTLTLKEGISSTPVIDLELGRIYILTRTLGDQRDFHHKLYSVSLNGKLKSELDIALLELVPKAKRSHYQDVITRIHCKTALGLNRRVTPPYVFVGCSIATKSTPNEQYASQQGIHGFLVTAHTDTQGDFEQKNSVKGFLTSEITDNPMTGFDTGIYNLGSSPSVLDDGSLLLATGNGPTFLESNNFGCSVVRLDGHSLSPKMARSINGRGYNECWYLNLELSSSAVANLRVDNSYISTVLRKDGKLMIFDPDKLAEDQSFGEFIVGQKPSYGQPVIFKNKNNNAQVMIVGHSFGKTVNQNVVYVGTQGLKDLPFQESFRCVGFLLKDASASETTALHLLYSGPLRNHYTNALSNGKILSELTSFSSSSFGHDGSGNEKKDMWAPYQITSTLGFSAESSDLEGLAGFELKALSVKPNLRSRMQSEPELETIQVLAPKSEDQSCKPPQEKWAPLYELYQKEEFGLAEGLFVHSFSNRSGKFEQHWQYRNQDWVPQRSHNVGVINEATSASGIIFTADQKKPGQKESSLLVLLNSETGTAMLTQDFSRTLHFSMPLVLDDLIFLPTRDQGIKAFQISPSQGFKAFLENSLLYSLIHKLSKLKPTFTSK